MKEEVRDYKLREYDLIRERNLIYEQLILNNSSNIKENKKTQELDNIVIQKRKLENLKCEVKSLNYNNQEIIEIEKQKIKKY